MTFSRFKALKRRNDAHAKAMRGEGVSTRDEEMSPDEFRAFLSQSGYSMPTARRASRG